MKYVSKSRMWSKLIEAYPNEFGGCFTNGLGIRFGDNCIYLSLATFPRSGLKGLIIRWHLKYLK